jgi:hypothetical protein
MLAILGGDVQSPANEITGDPKVLHRLLAPLDQPEPDFHIVTAMRPKVIAVHHPCSGESNAA